jgi:hypothetical protein
VTRDLKGTIDGTAVRMVSLYPESHGDALSYRFAGTCAGDQMSGTVDMGEYLNATWTAHRTVRRQEQN